jgi:hypothetical protein
MKDRPDSLFDQCVVPMALTPLPEIKDHTGKPAGYGNAAAIQRYFAADPLYAAVHLVGDAPDEPRSYGVAHTHPFPEVNILAGLPGELVFRIRVDDDEREIVSPAIVVIPPGVVHSANLVRGTGSFVVLRLDPEQIAQITKMG